MSYTPITAVGIDVSKGKSTVAVRRPGGEVVLKPFDVQHNTTELQKLVATLLAMEVLIGDRTSSACLVVGQVVDCCVVDVSTFNVLIGC